jgi:hypothetical protein
MKKGIARQMANETSVMMYCLKALANESLDTTQSPSPDSKHILFNSILSDLSYIMDTMVIMKNKNKVMNANRYRYSSFPDTNVISRKQRNISTRSNPLCIEQQTETAFLLRETRHVTASAEYMSMIKVITYFDNSIT